MDLMYAVVEAVFISFFMGAILGGIAAVHFSNKRHATKEETHDLSNHDVAHMEPVKIKVKR